MFFIRVFAVLIALGAATKAGIEFRYSTEGNSQADKILKSLRNEFEHVLNIREGTSDESASVIYTDKIGHVKSLDDEITRLSVMRFFQEVVLAGDSVASASTTKAPKSTKKSAKTETTSSHRGRTVLALNSRNFDKSVLETDKAVFVKFYAPWCGHCQAMADDWKKLAKQVDPDVVVIAEVDADAEKELAQRFGIRGFPTLKLFPAGKKPTGKIIEYDQPDRSFNSFMSFLKNHVKSVQGKIKELTSQSQFDKECSNDLCMITFLPHILDSSPEQRKTYIKTLDKVRTEVADLPIKHFWTEASNSLQLEEFFRLGFGWPATIIVNNNKKIFAVHKGRTTDKDLVSFASSVSSGRFSGEPYPNDESPKWPDLEPWSPKSKKRGEL